MGSSGRVITTADILDGTITPADIDPQSTIDRIMASNGAGAVGWNQLRNGMVLDRELAPIKVAPGGVASTVMRTTDGTTASFGKIQAADMDALPGSAVVMLLNHVENTDLFSGSSWPANVSQPFGTAKSFTVQSATSIIEIAVRVGIYNTSNPATGGETQSLLIVDGAVVYRLGSAGSNSTGNPFAGAQPVYITGLSAGTHSVQVWAFGNATTNGWYCRCGSQPTLEYFTIQVIEHKIGLGIKGDKGDTGASAQTAGGPRLALNYALAADISGFAVAANTWTTITSISIPSFSVDLASSLVTLSLQMNSMMGGSSGASYIASRFLLDGAVLYQIGGMYQVGNTYTNVAAGGSSIVLGSLTPGAHTLALQCFSNIAESFYCRPSNQNSVPEWCKIQVLEHKLGGAAWTPKGAWDVVTAYGVNDVVTYQGGSYVALVNHTGTAPVGSPTTWMQIAAVGATGAAGTSIIWRGLWSAGAAYVVNDAVTNAGTTYICILASTGHNPASDGGVHWQVMVAPGSMVNPMTTADDIIKGGSAGVPNRVAKGTASTVFGVDSSGVLGYRQVVNADIALASIIGGSGGVGGSRIAPGTIYGSIDLQDGSISTAKYGDGSVTSAKIADNSIVGGDINTGANISVASLTLSGGIHTGGDVTVTRLGSPTTGVVYFGDNAGNRYIYYDGTNFNVNGPMVVGNLTVTGALSLPARSITGGSTVLSSPNGAVAGAGWGNASVVNSISGLIPNKSYVLVIMTLTHSYTAGGVAGGIGIGIDTVAGPSSYTHFLAQTANVQYAPTVSLLHQATATGHTYYGLIYTGSASANVNGWPCPITVIAFHA